jgi:hypothetical protein
MKFVAPIALFTGGVLVAVSALMAMVLWIHAAYDSQLVLPQPPPASFASTVEQSLNLEGVKRACTSVAQGFDMQNQIIRAQADQN